MTPERRDAAGQLIPREYASAELEDAVSEAFTLEGFVFFFCAIVLLAVVVSSIVKWLDGRYATDGQRGRM